MQEILDLLFSMGLANEEVMGEESQWSGLYQDIPDITGQNIGDALGDLFGFGDEYAEGLFEPRSSQQMKG